MKKLAQVWKDIYKTSGSKESGMEKVLSMLNGMFSTETAKKSSNKEYLNDLQKP